MLRPRSFCTLVLTIAGTAAACAGNSTSSPGSAGSSGGGPGGTTGGGVAAGTSGGVVGTSGTGGSAAGAGGSAAGTGGGVVTGTAGTTGGAEAGGSGGSAAGTSGGGAGGGAPLACPSNSTFCSGFEAAGLPAGAIYMANAGPGDWSRDFAIDTTQHHAGASSLLVKNQSASGSSGSQYRMLAVPVPSGGAFWVRFWVESDTVMGGSNPHNAFAGPSPTSTPNDPIDSFAEDVGISFHTLDSDVTWPTGYGRLPNSGNTNPYTLPAMTWACIEISYDLTNRHQQLYINGSLLLDATNYPPTASYSGVFGMFKFGFDSFNGPARQMWYDDVAVTPTRIPGGGCPPS